MTFSWPFNDFLMIFSWLSHGFLMTYSWFSPEFHLAFSRLSHDFLMAFHYFFMTFSWQSSNIWLGHELCRIALVYYWYIFLITGRPFYRLMYCTMRMSVKFRFFYQIYCNVLKVRGHNWIYFLLLKHCNAQLGPYKKKLKTQCVTRNTKEIKQKT